MSEASLDTSYSTAGGWKFNAPAAVGPVTPKPRPSFSVVVPAFQAGDFIGDALRSVLSQTEMPREVIVVDDGSTDDTVAVVRAFGDVVRLIQVQHGGPSAARNAGIHAATGDLVAFLDADDTYETRFLEALGALATARPDLDVLTVDARLVVDGASRGTFMQANRFPTEDQRAAVLERCFVTMMTAVRRRRLLEVGGFDSRVTHGEDWSLWIDLVLGGSRVGLVDAPLAHYRAHSQQLTARRGSSLRGRHDVLAALAGDPRLTAEEDRAVRVHLSRLDVRAATAEAVEARGWQSRKLWLHVARLDAAPRRTRLAAMARAVVPNRVAAPRAHAADVGRRRPRPHV